MRIYLLGMPGAGKTTVGLIFSELLSFPLIDLDQEIEKQINCSINDVFKEKGESFFRDLETKNLTNVLNRNNVIIVPGGGVLTKHSNHSLIKGIRIWVQTPLDIIEERIEKDSSRPLLEEETLANLYLKREAAYEVNSDLIIHNDQTLEQTTNNIHKLLRKVGLI